MNVTTVKQCTKCLSYKHLGSFYTKKTSKDGFENQCKSCRMERMNMTRHSRCIEHPLVTTKRCGTCHETKCAADFFKQRRNHDGLDTICKTCYSDVDHKRNQTDGRRSLKCQLQRDRRQRLRNLWLKYFSSKYGDEINCQACNISLTWFGDNQVFDHRHGGNEVISSPAHWLSIHMPTKENILIWESCDFGILCNKCNRCIPTIDRINWLENVTRYIMENVS